MDFRAARRLMVESQVRTNDVTDIRLQAALQQVPREAFVPIELRPLAYVERELECAPNRRLIEARDVAKLLGAAGVAATDLVCDIACGSGYTTAILAGLAEMVVAVEGNEPTAMLAQKNLSDASIDNAAVIVGDVVKGASRQGPFDLIVIASGAIEIEPKALLAQLKVGGRLAAVYKTGGVARGVVWRNDAGVASSRVHFDAGTSFVLPEFKSPERFTF